MRIALVSTAAIRVPPPAYGGTERVLECLAAGLVAAGHAVTLFATGDSRSRAAVRALYPRPVWPIDPLAELNHVAWSCAAAARAGDVDLLHVNTPAALPMTHFVDVPMVYTLHHPRDDALSRLYRAFPAVHYVAISERQRAREVPLPHVYTVHHGLDASAFPFAARAAGYVAFVGRFASTKAPHLAIDAASLAGVPIRLAGRPHPNEGEEYHEREIRPRLARPGVAWLGEIGGAAKTAHLARAAATLFPAAWEEPFGLVMIESMLCGTPVVAFPRGAAPEVIDEGVTGFLVDDVAAMAAAIPRAAALDRRRCRARAVERFDAARMVRDYLGVYRAAIAAPRPRGTPARRAAGPRRAARAPLGTSAAARAVRPRPGAGRR